MRPTAGARRGGEPLGEHAAFLAIAALVGEVGVQQLIEVVGSTRFAIASSGVHRPSFDQVDGDLHRGAAGALAVPGLQHVELALLHGELDVLHVAEVALELVAQRP
jgi:hypothetical protein